jgi:hypothetical protein
VNRNKKKKKMREKEKEEKSIVKENADFSLIISKIHNFREMNVMLDYDLAEKYEVETKRLKEAVRRNINRFSGDDFMFELSKDEWSSLRSQIATSKRGGMRYAPFAFTELGVAMLSSVLNSEKAIEVNKEIMRAFVAIRKYVLNYAELKQDLDDFKTETRTQIGGICEVLDEFVEYKKEQEKPRTPIGFKQNK